MTRSLKYLPHLLFCVSAVFLLSQCSNSNDVDIPPPPDPQKPYLTVTQELPAAPFGAAGGSGSLVFSTNEQWSITLESSAAIVLEAATDAWYSVTPLTGDAGKDLAVTVSVQPNETYRGRSVTLVLRGGESLEERIEVAQLKKNAIIADENRREITSGEQTLTVKVQANVTYGVEVKQGDGWIREVQKSRAGGLKEEEHRFTIEANPDSEARTGIVVFRDADSDLFDELTIVQAAWEDPDPERAALRAIYDAAGGDGWTHKENWCGDKPLGEWYGVQTDSEGHVTDLRLSKNNLTGTVSWKIAKLTRLQHLDLSRNALEGELTTWVNREVRSDLDNLLALETIDLSHNNFTGLSMPTSLYKFEQLRHADMSSNQIKGPIPIAWEPLFETGRVVDLILNNNRMYGDVPDFVQNHGEWSRLALQFIRQDYEGGGGINYTKDIRLPDFTFTDLRNGSQGSMRDVYSGNTMTMILNWNPLQEDSKTFLETTVRRFHTLFGQQGFAVVAITPEGEEYKQAAEQYLREHDVPYPVVTDYADALGRRIVLPAEPYPSYFLVDQYGKVSNDMFTGQYCQNSLYPEEPFLIDLIERPFQHTNNLNSVFKNTFGDSKYQSTDFSMDKKYETLQRATKGKGIDIVLIGEAYTDVDIATGYYKQVMEFAMESFFAIEPTKSYREYFNIHMVYAVSKDGFITKSSGKTALGVAIDNSDWFYISTAMYYLRDYYQVVPKGNYIPTVGIVINGGASGGITTLENYILHPNYAFTGFSHGNRRRFREVFIHETVGHGFGGLGDEYIKPAPSYQGEISESESKKLRSAHSKGWFLNLSLMNDPKLVYWKHLIEHPKYPYVGIHQGGNYFAKGVWRSESCSLMDNESDYYFNAICRELIVKTTLKWAEEEYTFEKFLAKDSDEGRLKSSAHSSRQANEHKRQHQPPIIVDSTNR